MPGVIWKETFADSAYNTNIAAAALQTVQSTEANKAKFAPFNRLLIHNRDAVDIKIYLDGLDVTGRIFQLSAGEILLIEPGDGITFVNVKQENIDAATAETADKILFRWAKAERVL